MMSHSSELLVAPPYSIISVNIQSGDRNHPNNLNRKNIILKINNKSQDTEDSNKCRINRYGEQSIPVGLSRAPSEGTNL